MPGAIFQRGDDLPNTFGKSISRFRTHVEVPLPVSKPELVSRRSRIGCR
jgi:hypothetical protein